MLACVPALAHRRDEYLQAARIAVEPSRIGIELDITPGIAIAPSAVAGIDRDRDGRIDESEAKAYATEVLSGLRLEVDGLALTLELVSARAPVPIVLMRGEGAIQIALSAALPSLEPGRHRVFYRNDHHPADAAYLANALKPSSGRVEIDAQRRDVDQRELTIEYSIDREAAAGVPWAYVAGLVAEVAAIAGLGMMLSRRRLRHRLS